MKFGRGCVAFFACLLIWAPGTLAVTSGKDLLVSAAGRGTGRQGSLWITDLVVLNVDTRSASVKISWLVRDQANPTPLAVSFTLPPGETLVLDDVVRATFGMNTAWGALRVVADREVVVHSRIYNLKGSVTFGQGVEGVPRLQAIVAGGGTDVVGLRHDASFRTNLILIDASDDDEGSTVELSLRDRNGAELAAQTVDLDRLEPMLYAVTTMGVAQFEYASLHAEVTRGLAIVAASKVDNDPNTGDPTTLEAWTAGATQDGTYQLAIYDSLEFASGGSVEVARGFVQSIIGTYFNWDKAAGTSPACTLLFAWGGALSPPIPLADFVTGVTLDTPYPDSGEITYTVQFVIDDNQSLSGTVSAVGAGFAGLDSGCNGTFPVLDLRGGKAQ